ncbi:MAG: ABC transporter ATP-binding protein [Anaerolineae bacterium]
MVPPALQAVELGKQYATARRGFVPAIENVSFDVGRGEFLCLVGPSGCGKTTLLRLLAGLILPDSGRVFLNGRPVQGPRPEVGMVFQTANLMPWRTVFANILLPLQVQKLPAAEAARRVRRALALVGLTDFAGSFPRELSGGMQQRVAIARALVRKPQILLLDEPFGALDALTRERLNQELAQLWEASRQTVVMVTHNIREAVFLADRVLVLSPRPGRVVASIPVPFRRPRQSSLFYHSDFGALAFKVRQAIG